MIDLAKAKECKTTPRSCSKLVAQRFKIKHNGTVFNADAYGVRCMRIDAQSVNTMLKNIYPDGTSRYVKKN
jgi:hypothetical protein